MKIAVDHREALRKISPLLEASLDSVTSAISKAFTREHTWDGRHVLSNRKIGATTVADGGSIAHGLKTIPRKVTATASRSGEFVSVTAIALTTFTVAIKTHANAAGTTQTIYWDAEY